jgi:hypothetical protein
MESEVDLSDGDLCGTRFAKPFGKPHEGNALVTCGL